MAAGETMDKAARQGGVATVTVKLWRREQPEFMERVAELRAELTAQVVGLLVDAMSEAARTLRRLLKSKSETVRLKAAESLLNQGVRVREAVEMEARVAALEGGQAQPPARRTA
jgi:hypothetical protein